MCVVLVNHDRDHAGIEFLRLKELSNERSPSKTAVGTHHQEHPGVLWKVLIWQEHTQFLGDQREMGLEQPLDDQRCADDLLVGLVND